MVGKSLQWGFRASQPRCPDRKLPCVKRPRNFHIVIPAQAGTQCLCSCIVATHQSQIRWVPACAGMTALRESGMSDSTNAPTPRTATAIVG